MSKEDDKVQLLNAIKLVHQHVKLDNYLQDILIAAVKQLKKGDLPSFVAYTLVNRLSYYFMSHVGTKQNKYIDELYKLASKLQNSYRGFFTYI